MKQSKRKTKSKRSLYAVVLLVLVVAAAVGGGYYHHYEYQAISYKFSNGTGATISRHELNEMTPVEKQAFLHPVNEAALHPCTGNPMDQCIATPAADFWPVGSEGASNPYLSYTTAPSEIMGRIVTDSGDTLQLKTTSGRLISVVYPLNPVTNFNTNYADGGYTVDVGDEIYVSYSGPMTATNTLQTNQILSSSVLLKGNPKTSLTKY